MPTRNSLLAAGLLTFALFAASPTATACGDGLDERCTYPGPADGPIQPGGPVDCATFDPGEPGGGVLGLTEWFATATTHSTCILTAATQDTTLQQTGDAGWVGGTAAVGAQGLANVSGLAPAASTYHGDLEAVAGSQAYDTCFVLLGPFCGSDTVVDQTQRCPSGVAIPNPVPGSLTGNTLENGNGALQATCPFVGAVNASVPGVPQVQEYANATEAAVVGQVMGIPGPLGAVTGAVFQFVSDSFDNTCIYLTESTPCV